MKTFRNAGIAMFIWIILSFITSAFTFIYIFSNYELKEIIERPDKIAAEIIPLPVNIITILISIIVVIFTYLGYIKLGKKFDNHLLIVTSWILLILLAIYNIVKGFINYHLIYLSSQNTYLIGFDYLLNITFLISMIVFFILLGVSLLKLKDKIEMSKTIGILYIISASTMIIFVGSLLLLVTQIFAAIMFLKASKKFEK